jgi:hypothetical protein
LVNVLIGVLPGGAARGLKHMKGRW